MLYKQNSKLLICVSVELLLAWVAILIAVSTVNVQVLQAAMANPVKEFKNRIKLTNNEITQRHRTFDIHIRLNLCARFARQTRLYLFGGPKRKKNNTSIAS
jgi:hypothetical protein